MFCSEDKEITVIPALCLEPFFVLQVVFRGGEGSLQCLPPLIDVIPEARLNLVIYYLKQGRQLLLEIIIVHTMVEKYVFIGM